MRYELTVKILENRSVADGVCLLRFSIPEGVEGISCGKFVNLSVGDGAHLLRRPIAVCEYDDLSVTVCYQVKGEGTQLLSRKKIGDELTCVLPLGNGFTIDPSQKKVALIGGGVGVFPMISVLQDYADNGKEFYSYVGFRNKGCVCMEDRFIDRSVQTKIVTDDGSYGEKNNAVSAFFADVDRVKPDLILSCGPVPMLRALKTQLNERNIRIPCFVSLEERMACGIGACLVCVCQKSHGEGNARVCKDGPVFDIKEVEI